MIKEPRFEAKQENKPKPNFYELLGISEDASTEEVEKAYKKQLIKYHPDRVQAQGETVRQKAEAIAKDLGEAYLNLKDPAKRKRYDYILARQVKDREQEEQKPESKSEAEFMVGRRVNIRRSNGDIESDWIIDGYLGDIVQVHKGYSKITKRVPKSELRALNMKPLAEEKLFYKDIKQQILQVRTKEELDHLVQYYNNSFEYANDVSNAVIQADKFIVSIEGKKYTIGKMMGGTNVLFIRETEPGEFNIGDLVKVQRSDGSIESGWLIQQRVSENSYKLVKEVNGKIFSKMISLDDLRRLNN